MKRTFGVIGCAMAAGLVLCLCVNITVAVVVAALCVAAAIVAACLPRRWRRSGMLTALLSVALVIGLFAAREWTVRRPLTAYHGTGAEVTAVVTEVRPETAVSSATYTLRVTDGDLPIGTKLRYWQSDGLRMWEVGDGLTGRLWLTDVREQSGSAAVANAMAADGVFLYAWPIRYGGVSPINAGELNWFEKTVFTVRSAALDRLTVLSGDAYGVTAGICLGEDSTLSDAVAMSFRRSGVSHLLVVSGLHVSLVAMGLFGILRRWMSSRTAVLIVLPILASFVCLMGLTASVVRAGVMVTILLAGHLFTRQADSLNSLGLAFAVLVLVDPFCVYDIGLQLSFGATLGIVLLYKPLFEGFSRLLRIRPFQTGWRALPEKTVSALAVTLAATLPILPLTAVSFGEISLVSPLTNLLTVWAATWNLTAGWLTIAIGLIPVIGGVLVVPIAWVTQLLADYLIGVTDLLGGWSGAVLSMHPPYRLVWLFGSLALLALGYRLMRGRGLRVAAVVSAVCLLISSAAHTMVTYDRTTVTVESRFGGTAVLFEKNGNAGLVLDGNGQAWKIARYLLEDAGHLDVDFLFVADGWDSEQYQHFSSLFSIRTLCGVGVDGMPSLESGEELVFWETDRLATEDGFVRVSLAESQVLLCPPDGAVNDLPSAWHDNDVVIFRSRAPEAGERLTASRAIWLCSWQEHLANADTILWERYPVAVPPEGTAVAFWTNGDGNIQ
ncbi:MAG: ComEC/Rec2 family competence protein [Clostridia bacterium]|nr:ComEC/Rec2 family competence protein [Clostridia bacterium]